MAFPRKFGRNRSKPDPQRRELYLRRYLVPGALPPLSRECINSAAVGDACGMLGNDRIGDCVIAAAMHLDMDWTANVGPGRVNFTDEMAVLTYSTVTGYNPSDPSTDNGTDPVTFLKYWRDSGIMGRTIGAWIRLAQADLEQLQYAIDLFGGCFAGFMLPDSCLNRDDWMYTPDPADNPADLPNRANGHMVEIADYVLNPFRFRVRTWGTTIDMSPAFFGAYCDEPYIVLSEDMLRPDGKSPDGFDLATLQMDLRRVAML